MISPIKSNLYSQAPRSQASNCEILKFLASKIYNTFSSSLFPHHHAKQSKVYHDKIENEKLSPTGLITNFTLPIFSIETALAKQLVNGESIANTETKIKKEIPHILKTISLDDLTYEKSFDFELTCLLRDSLNKNGFSDQTSEFTRLEAIYKKVISCIKNNEEFDDELAIDFFDLNPIFSDKVIKWPNSSKSTELMDNTLNIAKTIFDPYFSKEASKIKSLYISISSRDSFTLDEASIAILGGSETVEFKPIIITTQTNLPGNGPSTLVIDKIYPKQHPSDRISLRNCLILCKKEDGTFTEIPRKFAEKFSFYSFK